VRIKAGYGVNLTERNINAFRKCLEPVGWQVSEIALYGPQLLEHDSGSP
jgi:hypothetical protein